MSRPAKRARGANGLSFQISQKRPIDKSLVVVSQTLNTTQQSTDLVTATFPCTVTGIRWDGTASAASTAGVRGFWALVLVKDGNSANTMAVSDGSTLYEPEQNVLAFGHFQCYDTDAGTGPGGVHIMGSTKTMRKLMGGDKLSLITIASATGGPFNMGVQFFCKS